MILLEFIPLNPPVHLHMEPIILLLQLFGNFDSTVSPNVTPGIYSITEPVLADWTATSPNNIVLQLEIWLVHHFQLPIMRH